MGKVAELHAFVFCEVHRSSSFLCYSDKRSKTVHCFDFNESVASQVTATRQNSCIFGSRSFLSAVRSSNEEKTFRSLVRVKEHISVVMKYAYQERNDQIPAF